MRIFIFILSLCILLVSTTVNANTEIKTEKQKLSYALGIYFSQGFTRHEADIDIAAFVQAIEDVLGGNKLKLSEAGIQTALTQYQQRLSKERDTKANTNKTAGEMFLEENKANKEIIELDSGLQYKIIKKGEGEKPTGDSSVKVHYRGTLISGVVFDSSYDRGEPIDLSLTQVIKGWQEILPLMQVGSKWQIYVPSHLAYGEQGAGNIIGPNETLIFDIELLAIN